MFVEFAIKLIVIAHFIHVNVVVMGAHSHVGGTRRVLDDFVPLFSVLKGLDLLI